MSTRMRRRAVIRREEALARQAVYDSLSVQQKLERTTERSLFTGLGASWRETERLINLGARVSLLTLESAPK